MGSTSGSKQRSRGASARRKGSRGGNGSVPPDVDLSSAQEREIERRIRDIDDPTRYVIRERLLPGSKHELFYNVSDDMWAMDLTDATLFKRQRSAEAVRTLLEDRAHVVKIAHPPRSVLRRPPSADERIPTRRRKR